MLDVFEGDAFSVIRLTQAINDITYAPGRLGQMEGMFEVSNVDTTKVAVERKGDLLVIVPPTVRGGPGVTISAEPGRELRTLDVPHFEINDSIVAESIQNVRAFGTEAVLQTIASKVAARLSIHVNSFAATEDMPAWAR